MQKRQSLIDASRIFRGGSQAVSSGAGLGKGLSSSSSGGAPRIVVVCTLTQDVDPWDAIQSFEDEGEPGGVVPVAGSSCQEAKAKGQSFVELDLLRYRTTLQLHPLPYGVLYPLLDACKGADFVLFVLSSGVSVEAGSWGELAMRSLQAQGLPTVMAGCPSLHSETNANAKKPSAKTLNEVRKSLLSFTQYFAPEVEKIYAFDDRNEKSALLRSISSSTPRRVAWRDYRPWLISEKAEWNQNEDGPLGTLKITGWTRGAPMSANRLVHVPDFGDFIVDKITDAPHARRLTHQQSDVEMHDEQNVLALRDDEVADDLVSENEVNELDNEQTWPTEEELVQGGSPQSNVDISLPPARPGTTPSSVNKRHGANWIKEDNGEMLDEEEEDEDEGMEDSGDEYISSEVNAGESEASADVSLGKIDDDDDDYDEEYEAQQMQEYKMRLEEERRRTKEEESERAFPDEVDTPLDISARVRFQRYRGLKSLRTSEWDPYEDLPREYERIFQFDDYKKTRKRVEANAVEEGISPGVRITLWIRDVSKTAAERARALPAADKANQISAATLPFIVFGLLRHEHKKSVLNFTVARNTEYEATVKSKDMMVLCVGPRRIRVRPIYSTHDPGNNGKRGTNNVHKMERFLHGIGSQGYVAVGTCFGPVTFGGSNIPTVLFRERNLDGECGHDQRGVGATQMPHLVGTGNLLDADPTRIIAKRIVLTGHPYKVHKKTSTIRYMFFNPEDVRYFAPLELKTKMGRVGHISASLGTHGYFKAHFDGKLPLSQLDTVGMTLYKRSFPKACESFAESYQELPIIVEANDMEMT